MRILAPRPAVLGVLLLAAALRWAQPGLVEFKYDEVNITRQALGLAKRWAASRPERRHHAGDPSAVRSMCICWRCHWRCWENTLRAAVWGLAVLGVIAVALTYVLGRRVGGPFVGLMAALFMAANPWLIAYDRKLWAHIQVAFSVLLLLLAWDVVVRRRRWAAFWFPVVAILQVLAHVLAVLQALSWLGVFLVAPRRWWRRETGLGILAGAGLMIPYTWALANRWCAVARRRPRLPQASQILQHRGLARCVAPGCKRSTCSPALAQAAWRG